MDKYWIDRSQRKLDKSLAAARKCERKTKAIYKKNLEKLLEDYKELMKPYLLEDGSIDTAKLNFAIYYTEGFRSKRRYLEQNIYKMGKEIGECTDEALFSCLSDVYESSGKTLSTHLKIANSAFLSFDKERIERAVRTPWNGSDFSTRIWGNSDTLINNLQTELAQAISNGDSIDKTTKRFMQIYGKSYTNTQRLIRTETVHIHNQAAVDSYKALNVKKYEVLVEPDACEECLELDGRQFDINDVEAIPPLHPYCRCCVVPVL